MEQLVAELGADRVGIKLSPSIPFNSMVDSNPKALYSYLIEQLNKLGPAYIHLMQALFPLDELPHWPQNPLETFGPGINVPVITNGGYDATSGEAAIKSGKAFMVSYGTAFVANPDLPERFANNYALAEADRDTLYGGGDEGYIDYPAHAESL
jgi:N-ethylmaleimide reductase